MVSFTEWKNEIRVIVYIYTIKDIKDNYRECS